MARQSKTEDETDAAGDETLKLLGGKILEARKKFGLTQAQLAAKAGVGQSYIFELEHGTTNITMKTFVKMASVLEVDPRDLLPDTAASAPTRSGVERLAAALESLAEVMRERSSRDAEVVREFQTVSGLVVATERFLSAVPAQTSPAADPPPDNMRPRSPRKPR